MSDIFESIKLNLERTIQGLITKKSEFIYVDNESPVPANKTYSVYYLNACFNLGSMFKCNSAPCPALGLCLIMILCCV